VYSEYFGCCPGLGSDPDLASLGILPCPPLSVVPGGSLFGGLSPQPVVSLPVGRPLGIVVQPILPGLPDSHDDRRD
jgi:hypothetical protein